jgi:hypothetical protein
MTKLKLGAIADDNPVRMSLELPASVHRALVAYAELLGRTTGQKPPEPTKLIPPMLERFMATDRAFTKAHKVRSAQSDSTFGERSG